ncbi:hypothetical protein J2752_000835 [Halarchaeum rubridurum]|uniref:Uncharacterized protein n=1 Tax=Halarchaeum rubridurum TaxID=489911 RepID=A0A830FKH7_9EURY|nr:hypothetical protein [Halarchaeum rubridurum]MBP1953954.1 hypothetical protein [Halarchaeum rubridurum]GGM56150.1 hypothetical protein GCM10009017_02930 [Halarchaeum rubridurum]
MARERDDDERGTYLHDPVTVADDEEGLDDRQSWALVATLVFAGLVAPTVVYLWPPSFLGYRNAYMAVAMVPALILAVVGLWSVQATRS